jgi:IclR family transcriptional regulator, pca regulon regulatory protein
LCVDEAWANLICAVTPAHSDDPAARIKPAPEPQFSRSLEYGLALLECFSAEHPAQQISELADILGLTRSTTHRYLQTLLALERLEQDPKRRYRLSRPAAQPGLTAIETLRAETPQARHILEQLRTQTGHTTSMATVNGTQALYTHRLHAHGPDQYAADLDQGPGAHIPLHATAIGKALLASLSQTEQKALVALLTLEPEGPNTIATKKQLVAELNEIRTTGIATCDEEQAWGVRSIATAVPQPGRSRPLAISITTPASQHTTQTLTDTYTPVLIHAAQHI